MPSASAPGWMPPGHAASSWRCKAGCTFAAEPVGLFGWVDTGVDTDALAQRMLDEGYLLAPARCFHAERKPSTLMRINFATTQGSGLLANLPAGGGSDEVSG